MHRTRLVSIDPEYRRDEAENSCTIVAPGHHTAPEWRGFEALFSRSCAELRSICRRFGEPGVAVVACHARFGVTAKVCLASKLGTINTAIAGRHGEADLFLSADPTVALRHLAILTHPRGSSAQFSVIDLRTSSGFIDEEGERREAVTCDGPLFVRCGWYALFLMPVAAGKALPQDAGAAWAALPPRRVVPATFGQVKTPRPQLELVELPEPEATFTSVSYRRGPREANGQLVQRGEFPLGLLRIQGTRGAANLSLGLSALREGVLVGRYPRCDTAGLFDERVSRVHALILEVDGAVCAIDCASTNHIQVKGERQRVVRLESGITMQMGHARVDWVPVH
jgi:hypothetical protein